MSTGGGNDRRTTRPAPRRGSDADDRLEFKRRGRVTIDFSGPPLDLPRGMRGSGDGLDPGSEEEPTLDTSELRGFDGGKGRAGLVTESGEDGELTLDLIGFEGGVTSRPLSAADGWMIDREDRSSLPPSKGVRLLESATEPPPVDWSRLGGSRERRDFAPATPDEAESIADSNEGDALGLVDRSRPSVRDVDIASDMVERYALGDFTGALRAAELLLGMAPEHPEALRYARSSRERLEQLYSSRLGTLTRIAHVAVPDHEIRWLGLDHRAGFLLSRVDGCHSVDEILDVSGMPRLEALRTLSELVSVGAVRLVDP